jgi:CMP-N-acetylneuraminic acid synthetase/spore coat polysaccharide biosynthesis predicted glycosyltransferase SpsG
MASSRVLAVIPARGGSKGIPRKNVRLLAGKPLIRYAIENALASIRIDRVVVSTDDEEIAYVAQMAGAEVLRRPAELCGDAVPLDPVIHHAVTTWEAERGEQFDAVVTLQPTSPLLSPRTIDAAIERFFAGAADTLLSVIDDRHLSWTTKDGGFVPAYAERVNRQYLPPHFRETGGILVTRRGAVTAGSRLGPRIDLFEIAARESVDIDTPMDWWLGEKLVNQRRILLRVDGYEEIGLGHVYRILMLAARLIDHEVLIACRDIHRLGREMIANSYFPMRTYRDEPAFGAMLDEFAPHIVVNDILDTDAEYISALKARGLFVVNFEDLGPGSHAADLVINALYEEAFPSDNVVWGPEYIDLREEFLMLEPRPVTGAVEEVLITFGGTDANDYTARLMRILAGLPSPPPRVTVVLGLGYGRLAALTRLIEELPLPVELLRNTTTISKYMHRADLVFTSAGRTVYEVASLGTPLIVLAQNKRELHHNFARAENGIVNLGLGSELSDADIAASYQALAGNLALRQRCAALMRRHDLRRGMDNILRLIFTRYGSFRALEER